MHLLLLGTKSLLRGSFPAVMRLRIKGKKMANNSGNGGKGLYMIVGALIVVVLGLGYIVTQGQADKPDLAIEFSEDGIDIDSN